MAEETVIRPASEAFGGDGTPEEILPILDQAVSMVQKQAAFQGVKIDLTVEKGIRCRTLRRDALMLFFVRCLKLAMEAIEGKTGDRSIWIDCGRSEGGRLKLIMSYSAPLSGPEHLIKCLGMSPCDDIRKEFGGFFTVGADERGRSAISIILQEMNLTAPPPRPEIVVATGDTSSRILVVEDFAELAQQLKLFLQNNGYKIELAADGYEALRKLRTGEYQLILTDMNMPRVDGHLLIRSIAQEFPDRLNRVLIMTKEVESYEDLIRDLHLSYVRKPFSSKDMLTAVRTKLKSLGVDKP